MTARLTPLVGASELGGAAYLVRSPEQSLLLDCGDLGGAEWLRSIASIDACWLSHAHLDHVGAVPELTSGRPAVGLAASPATRRLLSWALGELAQTSDSRADAIARSVRPVPRREPFELAGLRARSYRAGHVLGARMLSVDVPTGAGSTHRVLYTGDFCCHAQTAIGGARLPAVDGEGRVDTLVMEGVLAVDEMADAADYDRQRGDLVQWIEGLDRGCLIGVAALGEGPEIAAALSLRDLPLAVHTDLGPVFEAYRESVSDSPSRPVDCVDTDTAARRLAEGEVVLAPGDQLEGRTAAGRLVGRLVERDGAGAAVVNRAHEGTPAARLLTADPGEAVSLRGVDRTVRASVEHFRLPTHAPRWALRGTVEAVAPDRVVLVHGQHSRLHALRRALSDETSAGEVIVPEVGDTIALR